MDDEAPVDEVAQRLGGKVSPAVLAMAKALLVQAGALGAVTKAVEELGGFDQQYEQIEKVSAHHGNFWEVLLYGQIGRDRAVMFDLAEKLEFTETSEDRRVSDALAHAMRHQGARGEYITAFDEEGKKVDISFATQNWRKAVLDKTRTGQFVRKHFEAMVFTALAEELRTGDVAVVGSEEYADWSKQLLDWEVVQEKLGTYLVEVGLCEEGETDGFDAVSFRRQLDDPFGRYVITTFVKGTNMGPYEAARHIPGVSGHELAYVANRHFSIVLLNEAIADLVNAHARLDISQAWGDGTTVAADGTHMDTYLDNLLAETSVRYGKPGGIAYHHISDTYVALFTHFIPCGVWEAVYIIEGLLKNSSEVKPTTVHADTQGQSQPVFALAHLLGFDLMPRIRNWKGLTFYRPSKTTEYVHIDALFGEAGKNVIDWDLIESQFRHLMKVALSVREGAISSSTLLKRLRSGSKKNATYAAFREVGRVIRTVQLLRYLSDPALRRRVTAATIKTEAFNGFSQWIGFGNRGVIADNDPVEQEKVMKRSGQLRDRPSATGRGLRDRPRGPGPHLALPDREHQPVRRVLHVGFTPLREQDLTAGGFSRAA
ncbi:transposase [Streptomyces sp. NBC_00690]|uniref:transposase n=1 Tax=Streptomyces sp. NBC_00690 TaxID=2975808 RepID=UPI002E2C25AF|nr:transposase [Streptomyces sp. NBC_00690]